MKVVGSILMCAILSLSVLSVSSFFWRKRIYKASYPRVQDFPYAVYLESGPKRNSQYHYCAGVLVSRKKVLTSGLCMIRHRAADGSWKNPMINALVGATRCDYPEETVPIVNRPIFPPDFKKELDASDNDLAIIDLQWEVQYNKYVMPVKINKDAPAVQIGERLTVLAYGWNDNTWTYSGAWGYLSQLDFFSDDCPILDFPVKITKENMPICYSVNINKLESNFNEVTGKFAYKIKKEGYESHISDEGDFGGPVLRTSDRTLVGITSGILYNKTSRTLMAIHSAIHAKKNLEFLTKNMSPAFH